MTAAYELDRPTGWVQVRENAIQGTRLSLERDLGIRAMSTATVTVRMPVGAGALALAVSGITLNGSAVLGDSVHFNGSTLMGGTVLKTRTEPPDFTRVVIGYEHRMLRIGRGGDVVGRVGLDATFLNFRLRGTLSPTSVGHETKEDFVTQELPCPFVGAAVRLPVGDRLMLDLSADGGGLPWVSSLRYEGGLVSLTQRRLDGRAGFDVALTPGFSAGAGFDYTSFIQNEQSHEDGNQIMLGGVGGSLRLTWKF